MADSARQYYTGWHYYGKQWYRMYYYKPSSNYKGWKYHYVYYYPDDDPDYCYFWNPYPYNEGGYNYPKGHYWGRYKLPKNDDDTTQQNSQYEILQAANFVGPDVPASQVKSANFQQPGDMPTMPKPANSGFPDSFRMEPPPSDLPPPYDD